MRNQVDISPAREPPSVMNGDSQPPSSSVRKWCTTIAKSCRLCSSDSTPRWLAFGQKLLSHYALKRGESLQELFPNGTEAPKKRCSAMTTNADRLAASCSTIHPLWSQIASTPLPSAPV